MRSSARVLATVAALVAAPQLAAARAPDPGPSRPPGPAWTPGAAVSALAQVITLGAEALPELPGLCAPPVFDLQVPFVGPLSLQLGSCGPTPVDLAGAAAFFQLEARQIAAGPAGFLARLIPDAPAADFLPDLTALTSSPVPGVESSGFGWRSDPINHRAKFHKGTDFRARHGTPVYAAGAGRVVFTGQQHGYGNIIYVDHGGGVVTRYAHLSKFEIARGALVAGGSLIGRVGATGRATGPHLHFEVRLADRAVEPTLAMSIAALERTDPDAARLQFARLTADVQDHVVDTHDPPGRAHKADRRHRSHGSRPERRGAPHRVRNVS